MHPSSPVANQVSSLLSVLVLYDHCGYVNVFVGILPATGDVYGSSLCRLMTKRVASLQHIIIFTCDSFTPYSSSTV